jgi:hypothetical protein
VGRHHNYSRVGRQGEQGHGALMIPIEASPVIEFIPFVIYHTIDSIENKLKNKRIAVPSQ